MKLIIKYIILSMTLFLSLPIFAQNKNWEEVKSILSTQEQAWNKGDIEAFMQGYWKSDSLKFVGKNGVTYGWQNTFNRYKRDYPDRATMGILKFEIVHQGQMDKKIYFVIGKWFLKREEKGDIGGYFSLIFKKINGKWYIAVDHTS
jgi:ketosteroid isomerase-like protein